MSAFLGQVFPTDRESCSQRLGILFPTAGNPVPDGWESCSRWLGTEFPDGWGVSVYRLS